ncbi:MAG: ester cyclase [Gammaproteobacteria bacterium]|nr:ester cyclase [Gammaproteobacteria bacterium]
MALATRHTGAYGADDDLGDYILGITFEIWEERGVDLIDQYYGPDTVVHSLDGIVHGSQAMIAGTEAMLAAFPDRLLLGDDVICEGDSHSGYSSHRVLSPMTNLGDSMFGPATGKAVRIMNMADCAVEEGVITREWLARDNLALVRQLGFDVHDCAALIARNHTAELRDWFTEQIRRLESAVQSAAASGLGDALKQAEVLSERLLAAQWKNGDAKVMNQAYAPYAVMHRSPVEIVSGRTAIEEYYRYLRHAFTCNATRVEHIATQPAGENAVNVATRWAVCGEHSGEFLGTNATGKPVYIMGVTHRRIIDDHIAVEWTVFDSLAVLSQLL